ncbi:hypothetical protein GOV10_03545 [Candidatus Woesearchaeota archaeon]|nr:hypothetical protein [Candidatus Woesearchaeota archaeon]
MLEFQQMYRTKTDDYIEDHKELTHIANSHAGFDYIIFVDVAYEGQFCVTLSDEPLEEEYEDHTEFSVLEQIAKEFKIDAEEHGYVCLDEGNLVSYD